METKKCKKCEIEKPLEQYRIQKNRNGTYRYCSWCKECDKEYTNKWKREHQSKIYAKRKKYVEQYNKEYWRKNGKKISKKRNAYFGNRRKTDYIFKLKEQVRNLVNASLKNKNHRKDTKTAKIIGCDLDFFIEYLCKTFSENYGYEWDKKEPVHIDHIFPLAEGNTKEEILKLCHYTNLQLLKPEDNLKKGKKINYNFERRIKNGL